MILDIMLDIETLATGLKPAVIQISAVPFLRTTILNDRENFPVFNSYISRKANEEAGMQVDQKTLDWWASQSDEAKKLVLERAEASPYSLATVLGALFNYFQVLRRDHGVTGFRVWGNGSVFDNRILMAAYGICELPVPWKYNEDRDLRTLLDLAENYIGLKPKSLPFVGVQHDAIDDCKHQIRQAQLVFDYFELPVEW